MDAAMIPNFPEDTNLPSFLHGRIKSVLRHIIKPAEPGKPCPVCQRGSLDYDGCLVLRCEVCGHSGDNGCFT